MTKNKDEMNDSEFFLNLLKDQQVKPLVKNNKITQKKGKISSKKINKNIIQKNATSFVNPALKKESFNYDNLILIKPDEFLEFKDDSISLQRFSELKKGKIKAKKSIDLHGINLVTAENLIVKFIDNSVKNKDKCIQIIHGLSRYSTPPALMKSLVKKHLELNHNVLAFCSCRAKDGGLGAVFVLLRQ